MHIDHVLIAVANLEAAAQEMEARYGLASLEGGRHPGWGTANRIVPLGESYLELISVVDKEEAEGSAVGSWIGSVMSDGLRPIAWVVRTENIDDVARRLDLPVRDGSRLAPDGRRLEWRTAGILEARAEPGLPFFIQWSPGTPFPGQVPVRHPGDSAQIARLVIHGDAGRLAEWVGTERLPIDVTPGDPGVAGIVLHRAGSNLVIGSSSRP
jgi:hypothetical protein